MPHTVRRVLAVLALAILTTCGPRPPSAMELYRQDQIRQGRIAPPPEAAGTCEPVALAHLPIEVRARLLTVPVSINGQELRLVVDTGSERTTLSEAAAARLHLPRDMNRIRTATGIGGSVVNADGVVSDFTLGGVRLPPVDRVAIGRFGFDDNATPMADGLLGADILLAWDLDIDVPGRALTIYRVRRCVNNQPPWQEPFVALDGVTQRKDRLLIPFSLDGMPGRAILDTGATVSTIGAQMATRLGLTADRMSLDRQIVHHGVGSGSVTARYHWFRELTIGPAVTHGLMLSVLPIDVGMVDGLIGEDFLEGHRVWMSFQTRQIFVSKRGHEVAGLAGGRSQP